MNLRAILFDYGGTLDGAGSHWLDRFLQLYRAAGVTVSFDRFREAFDHATHCAYADRRVSGFGLDALVDFHVARQMEQLQLCDPGVAHSVSTAFRQASRAALDGNRVVLARLQPRVALGVVSNFYGNVDRLLDEAGLTPLLTIIIDSTRVGVSKPNPEIFALAVRQLGCAAADVLYVGDSFDKDVLGAHAAGLRTAWLVGTADPACPRPEIVDLRLRHLADLDALVA